jgi:cytochrome P450
VTPSPSSAAAAFGQWRARWHERRLYLAAHPFAYCLAAVARRVAAVCTIPRVGHIVSAPALAKHVLATPELFAKTGPGALSDALTEILGPKALLNMDGEPHRQLRARLRDLFAPRFAADLVASCFAAPLSKARAALEAGEAVDVARLARASAGRVACALAGIDLAGDEGDERCLAMYRHGRDFARALSLTTRRLTDAQLDGARERFDALTLPAARAFTAGVETTVPGRLRAAGLTFDEARGLIAVLLLAGTETTASALPRLVALLVDTRQWAALRANPSRVAAAVEEGLRHTAPVALVTRNVVAPTTLGGRRLRVGERVAVSLAGALKAGEAADDRDFHYDREQTPAVAHLWFGSGPHACPGAALARREMTATLEGLLACGNLRIVRRRYARDAVFAAYSRLDVRRA